jgi:hypothetical protein
MRIPACHVNACFKENVPKIAPYLKEQFDFKISPFTLSYDTFRTEDPKEIQAMYQIIASNNEIPEQYTSKLKEIVEKGEC